MINYKTGDIVLVPFPFSDQAGNKKRPAVVASSNEYNSIYQDVVIFAVTSRIKNEDFLIVDWKAGGLLFPSAVKPVVSTIDRYIILKKIGELSEKDKEIIDKVKNEIFGA